ncbi:hypothetical protein QNO07_05650 [Streptomyces sp. 549]|uniref:hypothetical protein n=1 Tax=Streptomyces sp. 549 TaxID=3049076 RepID=UPI0024C22AE7|nr:hypothetical protein [Streptomyces sp. 549]MDK1472920.1 hypothetical protein [Streptomyces sp. 549]
MRTSSPPLTTDDGTPPPQAPPDGWRRAHRGLLLVCGGFALLSAVLVPLTLPLGWDELVYASRFGPFGPATPFSSPRTRGVPLLVAPVASWSDSLVLLRVWLLLLAAAALYLGFRPWLKVLTRPHAVWVAAALYGTLWVPQFYAASAMPNHYTAMGAAAATGCLLQRRPCHFGVVAGLAVVTLMRPNDGAAVAAPLLIAAVAVPAWRSPGRVAGVVGGVAAGFLPWLVEAYQRYGGVMERLADASEVQGGMRPVFSVVHHLTALDGPLLCRPCEGDTVRLWAVEWWVLLPALVAFGLWATRRSGRATAPLWLAVGVALAASVPYFFFVPYAAPRFLLPAYALLALPAALGLLAAADRARRSRPAAAALVLVLLGHLAVQAGLAYRHGNIQEKVRGDWRKVAAVLHENGVRPPCVVTSGIGTIPLAHTAGCTSLETDWVEEPDAVILRETEPPPWAEDWPRHPVPGTHQPGWAVVIRR